MGADGGICWVRVRDRAQFEELVSWFSWRLYNTSAQAYKSQYAAPVPDPPQPVKGWVWVEGAFGTDCEFCFDSLIELVNNILEEEPQDWVLRDGSTGNVRDYTFAEIEEALITEPGFDLWAFDRRRQYDTWWWQLGPLLPSFEDHLRTIHPRPGDGYLSQYDLGHVPDQFKNMTLREWAGKVAEVLDRKSCVGQETWT